MPIQTIIFDWDGTLARTLHLWIDGYRDALARRNLSFSTETIVADFFHEHHLVADRHPQLDFAAVAIDARHHVFAAATAVGLHPGALATLRQLAERGIRLALVSSSPRALLERGLGAHDLAGHFVSVIAGDDGFGHKPDPLPFRESLRRMGAVPETTLAIGDSHVDILAGQAAGCRTCWFAPDENGMFHDFAHIAGLGADHRVNDLASVLAHL